MDFTARGAQPHPSTAGSNVESPGVNTKGKKSRGMKANWSKLASLVVLFGVAAVIVVLIILLVFGKSGESKYINTSDFQAVDISVGGSNGGDQIYFGKITNLNDQFLVVQNVFYIPASQSSSNITLEPLVCQIDQPFNQMVVNRSSVNWWENLQSTSQVVKSINSYEKTATGASSCPQTSSSTQSSSTSATPSSTTTPSTSTSTVKP